MAVRAHLGHRVQLRWGSWEFVQNGFTGGGRSHGFPFVHSNHTLNVKIAREAQCKPQPKTTTLVYFEVKIM